MGGWTLVSARHEFDDTEPKEIYGPDPLGSIVFTPQFRMMAILTSRSHDTNAPPEILFQSMMAYTGHFRLEGNELITTVDAAWIPSWVGSEQRRFATIKDDQLFIRTNRHDNHPLYPGTPVVGEIVWERDTVHQISEAG